MSGKSYVTGICSRFPPAPLLDYVIRDPLIAASVAAPIRKECDLKRPFRTLENLKHFAKIAENW